jgi:AmmeMemoRadiSam system protein B
MTSAVRAPAVAGRFYPNQPDRLLRDIRDYTSPPQSRISAIGCVAPHAGYIYSGHVAGAVYARLEIPEHCIILCPNHTGRGVPLAIMSATAWQTPLGEVAPSTELAAQLLRRFPALEEDSAAHCGEHGIEVQLPFLQVQQKNLHVVPIAVGTSDLRVLRELGEAMAEVIGDAIGDAGDKDHATRKILMIASSDMNHYEPDSITRIKDRLAIDRVLALDARGLWDVVMREDISMCGFGPTVAMLTAAKVLGATQAALVRYATSGDISGDRESVVGYAGITVE